MQKEIKDLKIKQAIKLWKKLDITEGLLQYSAGGDSMGDMTFSFTDKDGKNIVDEELIEFFHREVFNHVDFYECSDGYYMGESGKVTITLDEEEEFFDYDKEALYEYSETISKDFLIELTNKEIELINSKVQRIEGGRDDETQFTFKDDCIISDEEEKTLKDLEDKIIKQMVSFVEEESEEDDEWFIFTTDKDGKELNEDITIKDNKLYIYGSTSVTTYKTT